VNLDHVKAFQFSARTPADSSFAAVKMFEIQNDSDVDGILDKDEKCLKTDVD